MPKTHPTPPRYTRYNTPYTIHHILYYTIYKYNQYNLSNRYLCPPPAHRRGPPGQMGKGKGGGSPGPPKPNPPRAPFHELSPFPQWHFFDFPRALQTRYLYTLFRSIQILPLARRRGPYFFDKSSILRYNYYVRKEKGAMPMDKRAISFSLLEQSIALDPAVSPLTPPPFAKIILGRFFASPLGQAGAWPSSPTKTSSSNGICPARKVRPPTNSPSMRKRGRRTSNKCSPVRNISVYSAIKSKFGLTRAPNPFPRANSTKTPQSTPFFANPPWQTKNHTSPNCSSTPTARKTTESWNTLSLSTTSPTSTRATSCKSTIAP